MTDYKATPEHWAEEQKWVEQCSASACLLELRGRVEALEAKAKSTSNDRRIRSSLVHRVAVAIDPSICPNPDLYSGRARAAIRVIADEVERRGYKSLDLDPGETADWLRREAE